MRCLRLSFTQMDGTPPGRDFKPAGQPGCDLFANSGSNGTFCRSNGGFETWQYVHTMFSSAKHSTSSRSARVGLEIPPGSAEGRPRLSLKLDLITTVEAALRGNSPKPLVSRIQWLQLGSNLAWLAGAMCLGFAAGLQELGQGHLGWAAGWWLVMPVIVICLALSGLHRILRGEACLPCARSIPVIVVTANQPVDYRRHRVGALPRARDSIP